MLAPQAGNAGSNPARVTDLRPSGATGRHAALRTPCPQGLGSSTLPLVTPILIRRFESQISLGAGPSDSSNNPPVAVQVGRRPTGSHKAGSPGSLPGPAIEDTTPVGQSPAEPHTLRPPGATPGPAISNFWRNAEERSVEYANPVKAASDHTSGGARSLVNLWVLLRPRITQRPKIRDQRTETRGQ